MRVWTATEKEDIKLSQRNIHMKKAMDASEINVDLYE